MERKSFEGRLEGGNSSPQFKRGFFTLTSRGGAVAAFLSHVGDVIIIVPEPTLSSPARGAVPREFASTTPTHATLTSRFMR